jgi:hypothetical protein
VNETAQREFRVDRPMTLRAQYAEVYYWAVVETPANKTAGWMPKGAVLKFPDVVDFGNGTRLIKPSVREAVVEGPVALKVEYAKRQHYVKIEGVEQWEGWVDAGAVVRLNATVVGGVEYTPAEVVTASNPGVYRPLFYAVYKTAVRDALGVPNPLATVRLCDAAAQAGPGRLRRGCGLHQRALPASRRGASHQPLHSRRSRRSGNCGRPRAEEEEKITRFFLFQPSLQGLPHRDNPTGIIIPVRSSL